VQTCGLNRGFLGCGSGAEEDLCPESEQVYLEWFLQEQTWCVELQAAVDEMY